jgi:hypothetical protein
MQQSLFLFQVALQLFSRGCVVTVPDPLLGKIEPRTSGSVARNSDLCVYNCNNLKTHEWIFINFFLMRGCNEMCQNNFYSGILHPVAFGINIYGI